MAPKIKKRKEGFLKKAVMVPVRRIQAPIANTVKERNDTIEQLKQERKQLQNEHRQVVTKRTSKMKEKLTQLRVENHGMSDHIRRLSALLTTTDPEYSLRIPPFYRDITYGGMYRTVSLSPDVGGMHRKLEEEVLRRGNKWEPRYTSKCPNCNEEWHGEEPLDRCPMCDPLPDDFLDKVLQVIEASGEMGEDPDGTISRLLGSMGDVEDTITPMIIPNEMDHSLADKFFYEMNPTGQSLDDVDKTMEADINTCDMALYMLRYHYKGIDDLGVAQSKDLISVNRGNPILVRKVIDGFDNVGGIWWKCIAHSDQVQKVRKYDVQGRVNADFQQPDCPICGRPMHEAMYVQLAFEATSPDQIQYTSYFIAGEVIEGHYYRPNEAFGGPPLVPLFIPTATLIHLNVYVYDTFRDRRAPQVILWSQSENPDAAVARFDSMQEKLATDQTYIPHYVMETGIGGGTTGKMGATQLMPPLHEMQYIEYMDKLRQIIGNYYGIFYNSFARSSNNPGASEGPDMQVDPKTLESKQAFWNRMHDKLTDAMGISDWFFHKVPAEDRDVMRKLQIAQLEWQIAQQASTVGFETIRNPVGKLVQRKPPLDQEDISRLMDLVKTMIFMRGDLNNQAMEKEQSDVTFDPDPNSTPNGERGKQDKLQKGFFDKPTGTFVLDPEGDEEMLLIKGDPRGEGQSRPKQTSPQKTSLNVRTNEAASSVQTAGINPAGTQDKQVDKKGNTHDSKQGKGGADRSRDTPQEPGSVEQKVMDMQRLLVLLVMQMRTKQAPRTTLKRNPSVEEA